VITPDPEKVRITIRLDQDIIDWFREQVNAAGGANYQSLINKALREYIEGRAATLEATRASPAEVPYFPPELT
jgi:hypothetical protein